MDYEKKYKDALERAKSLIGDTIIEESGQHIAEVIFPELKEVNEKTIASCIGVVLSDAPENRFKHYGVTLKQCLNWLEKWKDKEALMKCLQKANAQIGELVEEKYRLMEQKPVNGSELKFETKGCPVDLGLPSGTLWCDRNVYATSPTDHGAFFSWGNVLPHFPNMCLSDWGKEEEAFAYDFDKDTYEETNGAELRGDIDLPYDAAYLNMGEPWRMPSAEQFQELVDNCVWSRVAIKGVNGYNVVSKINGRSIFFPCSGYGYERSWYCRNISGSYWSCSFNSTHFTRYLLFNTNGVNPQYNSIRYYGFPIRAIQYSKDK